MEGGIGLTDGRVGHAGGKEGSLDMQKGHFVGRAQRDGMSPAARRRAKDRRFARRVDKLRAKGTSFEAHPDDAVVA